MKKAGLIISNAEIAWHVIIFLDPTHVKTDIFSLSEWNPEIKV